MYAFMHMLFAGDFRRRRRRERRASLDAFPSQMRTETEPQPVSEACRSQHIPACMGPASKTAGGTHQRICMQGHAWVCCAGLLLPMPAGSM